MNHRQKRFANGVFVLVSWLLLQWPGSNAMGQVVAGPSASIAGMPSSVFAYDPKKGPTLGLVARIYPPFAQGPGYLDWSVEVSRADGKVFDHDHEISIRIYPNYMAEGSYTEKLIPLKQGARSAKESFQSVTWSPNYYWCGAFYSNGRELKGLSSRQNGLSTLQNSGIDNRKLLVFCEDDFDEADYLEEYQGQLTATLVDYKKCLQWSVPLGMSQSSAPIAADIGEVGRLPSNWLQLSRFTAIVLPIEAIAKLTPDQIDGLRTYLYAGGTISITRGERESKSPLTFKRQDEIYEKLSGLSKDTAQWKSGISVMGASSMGMSATSNDGASILTEVGMGIIEFNSLEKLGGDLSLAVNRASVNYSLPVNASKTLVASNTLPSKNVNWKQYGDRNSWGSLRGTNNGIAGSNFWNWMIPGIGKPPVWAFAAFIVLFAGIAGPVLAYVTIRARRPAWLIILFPIIAGGVTLILSGYAVIHDGFRTYVRSRSVTWYDLKSDKGFAWSRQTYFSGSPPRGGLTFRADSEVTPISWQNEFQTYRSVSHYRQVWEGDKQKFLGLLPHREQKQFLVRHPVSGLKPFSFKQEANPNFINHRPEEISLVVIKQADGTLLYGQGIKPNASALLESISDEDCSPLIRDAVKAQELDLPKGLVQGQQVSVIDWMQNRSSLASWNSFAPLMETELTNWSEDSSSLQPKSFILFLKQNQYIDRPLQADESDSLHVMVGSW